MDKSPSSPRPFSAPRYALTLLAVLLAWTGLYVSIQPLATWLTFDLLSRTPGGAPGLALEFFLYDSADVYKRQDSAGVISLSRISRKNHSNFL